MTATSVRQLKAHEVNIELTALGKILGLDVGYNPSNAHERAPLFEVDISGHYRLLQSRRPPLHGFCRITPELQLQPIHKSIARRAMQLLRSAVSCSVR